MQDGGTRGSGVDMAEWSTKNPTHCTSEGGKTICKKAMECFTTPRGNLGSVVNRIRGNITQHVPM